MCYSCVVTGYEEKVFFIVFIDRISKQNPKNQWTILVVKLELSSARNNMNNMSLSGKARVSLHQEEINLKRGLDKQIPQ